MLLIRSDPAGITGQTVHPWDFALTMQENIERHLQSGEDCELWINGVRVNPLIEPRLDSPPVFADKVVVARRPEGVDPYSWAYYAIVLLVAVAVSYAMVPKIPDSGVGKDSPNNSLTSQSNVARAYQAIPDVYGYRRVWPDLIQPSTVEYIDNLKYVTEWMCISRGVGTISSVQYAETAIGDIDGASYEIFEPAPSLGYPEFSTTTLIDVLETFASDEVNGQEIPYAALFGAVATTGDWLAVITETHFSVTIPDGSNLDQLKSLVGTGTALVQIPGGSVSQTCTVNSFTVTGGNATFIFGSTAWPASHGQTGVPITITPNGVAYTTLGPYTLPTNADRLRWNTVFLRGLKGSVIIRAEWWQIDSGGVEVTGSREFEDITFAADSYDQQFYTTNRIPTAGFGRYRIQFTRNTGQVSDDGSDVAKLEELYAVRHYPTKVLPGVTVFRVTTKATIEATGFSDRKFNVRWLRHVRTLVDDTLGESRNFARSMAHIWTLAGNQIADLDTAAMKAVNDEFGAESTLLRFDMSLDDADMSLGDRMQLAANMARGTLWPNGTQWTFTRDQARPFPEMQFDYRNLAKSGASAISFAAHLPASNDGVEIEYVDETSQSTKAYVRLDINSGVPVDGQGSNPKKIKMPGCTTQAQAVNRAAVEARRLIYQRTAVNDTALRDASALGIGALVKWIDPNDFAGDDGLQAGEVLEIAANYILTSEPLNWKGESEGRILFTGADGRNLSTPIRCFPVPNSPVTMLESAPAGLYVAGGDRQLGSRYSFGVGLTESEIEAAGLYTVTEIKPGSDWTVSLSLSAYDARIYQED